jgi:hypothetical protein
MHPTQKLVGSLLLYQLAVIGPPAILRLLLGTLPLQLRISQGDLSQVEAIQRLIQCRKRESKRRALLDWKARSANQFELVVA